MATAEAKFTTRKVQKTVEVEEKVPDGVTLQLTQDEAQTLRSLIGSSDTKLSQEAGLYDVYEALRASTGIHYAPKFKIVRFS